jgi:CheY-like chemotaxis protein
VHSNSVDGAGAALPLLHIDDSGEDRLLVEQAIFLTNAQFEFHGAASFEDALSYFQSHEDDGGQQEFPCPALVLLDYDLGKSKGTDFLYWLRVMKKLSSIPVVMFSGSAGRSQIAECYAAGVNYFLSKPTDLLQLKIIVRTLRFSLRSAQGLNGIVFLKEYQPDPREFNGHSTSEMCLDRQRS